MVLQRGPAMTPEELANARGIAKRIPEVSDAWLDRSNAILVVAANMLPRAIAHIGAQVAQIEAMKEKLISERMRTFDDWDGECFDTEIECPDLVSVTECHGCEIYERARKQLKAEMKEVSWE